MSQFRIAEHNKNIGKIDAIFDYTSQLYRDAEGNVVEEGGWLGFSLQLLSRPCKANYVYSVL